LNYHHENNIKYILFVLLILTCFYLFQWVEMVQARVISSMVNILVILS